MFNPLMTSNPRKTRTLFLLLNLLVAAVLALAACAPDPTPAPTSAPASTPSRPAVTPTTSAPTAAATPTPATPASTTSPTAAVRPTVRPSPVAATKTASPPPSPTPTPIPTRTPEAPGPAIAVGIPEPPTRDLYELARSLRLKSPDPIPRTTYDATQDLDVGRVEVFKLLDVATATVNRVSATLKHVSYNAYWYFEDGYDVNARDLIETAVFFEERILPELTASFGPLWSSDAPVGSRITILNARIKGLAGYYSGSDEHPSLVQPHSNGRKMVYVNSVRLGLGSSEYLSVLAHEIEHAIQWNLYPGRNGWLNEGLAQVAEHRFGWTPYTVASFKRALPVSLIYWPIDILDTGPHYGAAFLFAQFLADSHARDGNLEPLMRTPGGGITAVDSYLDSVKPGESFNSLFSRWIAAAYLSQIGDGPFDYADVEPGVRPTDVLNRSGSHEFGQPQYSARYLLIDVDAARAEVSFSGSADVPLIPSDPPAGGHCWWGNRGDSISSTLTREFDLSQLAQATLRFSLWHQIEADWDFAYVQVSTDGGSTWDILQGSLTTLANPLGNSYGHAYTGASDGWVEDAVDLTPYAGRKVLVRFHYVTDDAVNGPGLCLDTVSLPELGFYDDASSNQGWTSEGFYRTGNRLPQDYALWLIETVDGRADVRPVALDDSNQGSITTGNLALVDEAVLVVGSLARGSDRPAGYTVTLRPVE